MAESPEDAQPTRPTPDLDLWKLDQGTAALIEMAATSAKMYLKCVEEGAPPEVAVKLVVGMYAAAFGAHRKGEGQDVGG